MFMSKKSTYGLQALFLLADCDAVPLLARTIARTLDLPQPFLSKILQDLSNGGLLVSCRGRGGGFRLAKPTDQIRLLNVVELLERKRFEDLCVLGLAECSNQNVCLIRGQCATVREEVWRIFGEMSLEQLIEEAGDVPSVSRGEVIGKSEEANRKKKRYGEEQHSATSR